MTHAHIRLLEDKLACRGRHLVLGVRVELGLFAGADLTDSVAALLAEREKAGPKVGTLTLVVTTVDEARAIVPVIDWIAERGVRLLVRTRVRLSSACIQSLARANRISDSGTAVELELAHHRANLQRALLRADGSEFPASVAELLLMAQHLKSLGVEPLARIAPVLPGIHEDGKGIEPLLQHIAAADLHHLRFRVGQLSAEMHRALLSLLGARVGEELDAAAFMRLGRAFGIDPTWWLDPSANGHLIQSPVTLRPQASLALQSCMEWTARAKGLESHGCGCDAYCDVRRTGEQIQMFPSEVQPSVRSGTG